MTKEISFSCMHFIIAYEKKNIYTFLFVPPKARTTECLKNRRKNICRQIVRIVKRILFCVRWRRDDSNEKIKYIILRRPRLLLRWYKQMSVFCRLNVFCIIIVIKYELISFSVFHEIRFMLAHTCAHMQPNRIHTSVDRRDTHSRFGRREKEVTTL